LFIEGIKLKNYRNYGSLDLKINKRFNIIYGYNAQGKTNILEAVFICSSGRSHRTPRDYELIKLGEKEFNILINVKRNILDAEIDVSYEKEGKKRIKINEIPLKKIGDLMGNLNTVIFSPEDLLIIKEGPAERRRFIDITISQLRPAYFYDLQQYAKILEQRNTLLKEIQNNKSLLDTLEVWNQNLILTGSKIIKSRQQFIEKLCSYAKQEHFKLSGGKENLIIKYDPSFSITDFNTLEAIKSEFEKNLERLKEKEIFKGTTLIGPQRDDYDIFQDDKKEHVL
jgi:DNA replication and repair protein RecF